MINLLFIIKQFRNKYKDTNKGPIFIFMSATIDLKTFSSYYNLEPKWYNVGIIKSSNMRFNRDL